jgi:glycosyltransferase involved in cell wall biosynthesis
MHICFISHEYPLWATGGIGTFIQTLGRMMVKKGHRVTVVGIGQSKSEEVILDEGVVLYRLPAPRYLTKGSFIENLIRVRGKIKQIHADNPIDIVESPELGFAFFPHKTPYKKVIRMHGGHHFFAKSENRKVNRWKAYQEKRSFERADHLVAVSRYVAEETTRLLNLNKKAEIIYNFVNLQKFDAAVKHEVMAGQLLFIGTICEKKGVGKLIEAMPEILKHHPGVRLKLVGRDLISRFTGESYMARMKDTMPASIRHAVEFTGPVSHDRVPEIISQSQIVVLPSFMEAMPIAWLEVLAMGKPLVASLEGPGPEAVSHGETGLLCDPYSPDDIAQKVCYFLDQPAEAARMGEQAHRYALENFNFQKLVEDNIAWFERIISA